jgi:protein PET117
MMYRGVLKDDERRREKRRQREEELLASQRKREIYERVRRWKNLPYPHHPE